MWQIRLISPASVIVRSITTRQTRRCSSNALYSYVVAKSGWADGFRSDFRNLRKITMTDRGCAIVSSPNHIRGIVELYGPDTHEVTTLVTHRQPGSYRRLHGLAGIAWLNDRIYVGDLSSVRCVVYSADGTIIAEAACSGLPVDIAATRCGQIYVALSNGAVRKFDWDISGNFPDPKDFSFIEMPVAAPKNFSIAVNASGNLVTARENRIEVWSSTCKDETPIVVETISTQAGTPIDITFDSAGNLIVLSTEGIWYRTNTGAIGYILRASDYADHHLENPSSIAISPTTGELWILSSDNNCVVAMPWGGMNSLDVMKSLDDSLEEAKRALQSAQLLVDSRQAEADDASEKAAQQWKYFTATPLVDLDSEDVAHIFETLGVHVPLAVLKAQNITGDVLPAVTEHQMKEVLGIEHWGVRRRLTLKLSWLEQGHDIDFKHNLECDCDEVEGWSRSAVSAWLHKCDLPSLVNSFFEEDVDGLALSTITEVDFDDLGVRKIGDRSRLKRSLGELKLLTEPKSGLWNRFFGP
eukprot:m.8620 g.8620  ORF g.8620 m.8620 type:complete len:526 (-) comp4080_c0_seq1:245-1822(-)